MKSDPLEVNLHGIRVPTWWWNMALDGGIKLTLKRKKKYSRTAYIVEAVIEKARREGVLDFYKNVLKNQSFES